MSTFMFRSHGTLILSEAVDTDQSVALLVAKVTIDTDRWKSITETSTDTDNDHVSSNCDGKSSVWRVLTSYSVSLYYSGRAVLIIFSTCCVNCIDYGRGGRNGWKTVL